MFIVYIVSFQKKSWILKVTEGQSLSEDYFVYFCAR